MRAAISNYTKQSEYPGFKLLVAGLDTAGVPEMLKAIAAANETQLNRIAAWRPTTDPNYPAAFWSERLGCAIASTDVLVLEIPGTAGQINPEKLDVIGEMRLREDGCYDGPAKLVYSGPTILHSKSIGSEYILLEFTAQSDAGPVIYTVQFIGDNNTVRLDCYQIKVCSKTMRTQCIDGELRAPVTD